MNMFEDIRPYHDSEVRAVIDLLLKDLDLARAIAKFKLPGFYGCFPQLSARLTRAFLKVQLKDVQCVHDVQVVIEKYLDRLIENTATSLTQSGLEQLDPDKAYLFISNHRDITMDPALVNYMLYHHGFDTLRIAIGDNLLKKPFIAHLMRLNKSFIVKRSLHGREKLKASMQLSQYIHHSISGGHHIWIAQREGRAKNGLDKTESAIIKMLQMADRETQPRPALAETLNKLHIVPVSISYEYDPCDLLKAQELMQIDKTGHFQKGEESDVQSILTGMVGLKGGVHVSFGQELVLDDINVEDLCTIIDRQIIMNYRLWPNNYFALEQLEADQSSPSSVAELGLGESRLQQKKTEFEARLQGLDSELLPYILQMYANPLLARSSLSANDRTS